MKIVGNSIGDAKSTFKGIRGLIFGKDVHIQSVGESSCSLLSNKDKVLKSNSGGWVGRRSKSRKRGYHNNKMHITY